MATTFIKLEGAEELDRRLKALEDKVGRSVVRKAVRAGQKVLLAASRVSPLSMVGGKMGQLLSRSIVLKPPKRQRRQSYSLDVRLKGASEGAPSEFIHENKKTGKDKRGRTFKARHWIPSAIEYGHGRDKNSCAMPFMRTPAAATQRIVLAALTERLRRGIEAVGTTGGDAGTGGTDGD